MDGSAEVGEMVRTPAPAMLKVMVCVPEVEKPGLCPGIEIDSGRVWNELLDRGAECQWRLRSHGFPRHDRDIPELHPMDRAHLDLKFFQLG